MPTLKTILEENKEESLYYLERNLSQKIEELKKGFFSIWNSYKKECAFIENFHKQHIEEILSQFEEYKHPEEIKKNFTKVISLWNENTIQCNEALLYAYRLILEAVACYVLDSFIHRIACTSLCVQDKLPQTNDIKFNLDNTTDEICSSYKEQLKLQIFKNLGERIKYAMNSEIGNIKKQIHRFNEEKHFSGEFNKINLLNEKYDLKEKIYLLFVEEVKYVKYYKMITAEIDEYKELNDKRTRLIKKNTRFVHEFIDKIKARKFQFPEPNLKDIREYKEAEDHLAILEKTIDNVKKQNFMDPAQIGALKLLKQYFNDLQKENMFYRKDLSYHKWFFGYDISPFIDTHVGILEEELKTFKVDEARVQENIDQWIASRDHLNKQLVEYGEQLQSLLSQKLSQEKKQEYYEEIFRNKKNELLIFATRIPEIKSIKNEKFEKWTEELNKAWNQAILSEANLQEIETHLNNMRQRLNFFTNNEEESNNVTMAHLFISNKLKKLKNTISKKEIDEKQPNAHIVPSLVNIPRAHEAKPIHAQTKKSHWYDKWVDKPWKRALIISFVVIGVVAIACTGWGLLAEGASLAVFLAAMGGAGGAIGFGLGAFTFSFIATLLLQAKCHRTSPSSIPFLKKQGKLANNKTLPIVLPETEIKENAPQTEIVPLRHTKLFTEKKSLPESKNEMTPKVVNNVL